MGPAVIDLAALTGGRHAPEDRDAMVDAYRAVLAGDRDAAIRATSAEALTCARLHFAVQWLGWAPDWSPPEEQRQDWLTEAVRTGPVLGVVSEMTEPGIRRLNWGCGATGDRGGSTRTQGGARASTSSVTPRRVYPPRRTPSTTRSASTRCPRCRTPTWCPSSRNSVACSGPAGYSG